MISIRFYEREGEILLAACDEELLGRTLRSDGIKLTVSKTFYCKETVTEEELEELMPQATTLNLVGNRTVSIAKKLGHVAENGTITVEGTEHAQAVRM